jgi:hypothetical protein
LSSVDDLIMMPWTQARAALADHALRLRVLAPPYPAAGVGALRLLRVRGLAGEHDGAFELTCGYERYERL